MKWIIRNAETEDVLERFSRKDESPVFSNNDKKAKWFYSWVEVQRAVAIAQKCGYDVYPISEKSDRDN